MQVTAAASTKPSGSVLPVNGLDLPVRCLDVLVAAFRVAGPIVSMIALAEHVEGLLNSDRVGSSQTTRVAG